MLGATAPAPVASKPETKPETKSDTAAASPERDVENTLRAWAKAWSRKDLDGYFAAYAKDFDGGKTRRTWEEERRTRITSKHSIAVKISDVRVQITGDRAVVRFRQAYKADALNVSSTKTIEMTRAGGGWVITKENTGS
jgi:murein L,D-transpeptidase YafK